MSDGLDAYRASVTEPLTVVAAYCVAALGSRVVTAAVGLKDARVVRGWANGEQPKSDAQAQRLRVVYRVTLGIVGRYSADTAAAWWVSTNPHLGDRSPFELVGEDEAAVVAAGAAL